MDDIFREKGRDSNEKTYIGREKKHGEYKNEFKMVFM